MAQGPERTWQHAVTGPTADPFGARLERWVAEARVDDAALTRHRERALAEAAEQEATLVGVLADLAERGAPVSIEAGGTRHHGRVSAVGADFLVLEPAAGATTVIALAGLDRVTPTSGFDPRGDRRVGTTLDLAGLLARVAEDREHVRVATRHGTSTSGRLLSVGQDLIRLRVDGEPPTESFVPVTAIATLSFV